MNRTKKTFINASAGVISKFIIMIVAFLGRTVFIRTLGVEYLGASTLFSSILTMLSLVELGFATAITYNLYKPLAQKDEEKLAALMNFYKKIYNIIGMLVFVIGIALIPVLKYIISDDIPSIQESIYLIYVMYLVNTSVSYFFVYRATLLDANQNKYIASMVHAIVFIITTVCNSIALIVTKNFIIYLVIEIMFTIIYNVVISMIANKKHSNILKNKKAKLDKEDKKNIFNNVKAMFLYKVSGIILDGTDNIIINKFFGTVALGLYSNYYMIINQVYLFILQIFHAATASVGNLAAEENREHQEKVFKNMIFLSFVIYFICSVLLLCCFTPFITLWLGQEYLLELPIVTILVVNFYTAGMISPITSFRTANGLFMQGRYRPLIMAIINIAASIILAQQIGLIGVFIGTLIARCATQIWYDPWLIYNKVFNKSSKEYFIKYFVYIGVTILGGFIAYILSNVFTLDNMILQLSINIIISCLVVLTFIVVLFRKTEEYQYVKNIIEKVILKIKGRKKTAYEN